MRKYRQIGAYMLLGLTFAGATWILGNREANDLRGAQHDASLRLWQSQLHGCARANQLRLRTNTTRSALRFILVDTATSARSVRSRDRYLALATGIPLEPVIDCARAYPRP